MDPDARAAADAFGLPRDLSAQSLCKYGPVYHIADRSGDLVLKRTGYPHSGAIAIGAWLRFLKGRAIDVVAPVDRFSPNPRSVGGNADCWVVYPFIPGAQFTGGGSQLEAAGSLLAAIHVEGELFVDGLMVVDELPVHDISWTNEHIGRATEAVERYAPDLSEMFLERINTRISQLESDEIKRTNSHIKLAACSWDFKASNLIVNAERRPVLIDPNHAGRIPRIYDLACAALQFNCDHPPSPARIFNRREWRAFRDSYLSKAGLTQGEYAIWKSVLTLAWLDQGVWLLGNWPEGWEDRRELPYLRDLAVNTLDHLGLGKGPNVRTTDAGTAMREN